MHRPNAFRRVVTLIASMSALMSGSLATMPGVRAATQAQAYDMLGGYSSNGKGKTKTHDRGGNRAHQRAAMKKRNQQRHRAACRS